MRSNLLGTLAAAGALIAAAAPALAHHSFAAIFDSTKRITIKGAVTRVDWRNPHMYLYVDAAGPDGQMQNWACETFPPNVLVRQGWKRTDLKPGDVVTISGTLAKDGSPLIFMSQIVFPDGSSRLGGGPPTADGTRPAREAPPQQ
jgi:hypothetical protein